MFLPLPEEYIVQQFLIYGGYARRKASGVFEAGCPICREGKSWGSKRRCFYIPKYDNIHCKNCNRAWHPRQWIAEVSGKSYHEITVESKEYEFIPIEQLHISEPIRKADTLDRLPKDSINLLDEQQIKFYKDNKVVQACLEFIHKRRLTSAVNGCDALYVSLTDFVHKNRLCIPFKDNNNTIFYQTRTVLTEKTDLPKYLGKCGGDKSVFGVDRIDTDNDYIFIFEGPIDAMFVKNGVAVAGVNMTDLQTSQLAEYQFHNIIWVMDNQHIDETAKKVTHTLLDKGETVFIWQNLKTVKDFNDICCLKKINEISADYIVKNSFTGIKGKFQMRKLGL